MLHVPLLSTRSSLLLPVGPEPSGCGAWPEELPFMAAFVP
jgi:hypothetical protein